MLCVTRGVGPRCFRLGILLVGAFGGASNYQANGVASEDGKSMPFPRVTFAQSLELCISAWCHGVLLASRSFCLGKLVWSWKYSCFSLEVACLFITGTS